MFGEDKYFDTDTIPSPQSNEPMERQIKVRRRKATGVYRPWRSMYDEDIQRLTPRQQLRVIKYLSAKEEFIKTGQMVKGYVFSNKNSKKPQQKKKNMKVTTKKTAPRNVRANRKNIVKESSGNTILDINPIYTAKYRAQRYIHDETLNCELTDDVFNECIEFIDKIRKLHSCTFRDFIDSLKRLLYRKDKFNEIFNDILHKFILLNCCWS